MASTNPTMLHVSCPGCKAGYDFPASMAGRRGPCAKCGTMLTIPAHKADRSAGVPQQRPVPPKPPATEPSPQYVSVNCRLCDTRLTGRLSQVGQELKCPDCGARSVLPPPPKPKPKNIPAAMEGEQYELWEVDEQPLPSELIKTQPKYIAVECRMCQTLMQASQDHVGQTIACPDCGTKHVVPQPETKRPQPAPARDDGVFVVHPPTDPAPRPPVILPPVRRMLYEVEQEEERAREAEAAKRGKRRGPQRDARGRPIMPAQPLLTGVIPFLFSRGVPVRWIMLAIVPTAAAWLALWGMVTAAGGGFGAVAGMCFFAAGSILGLLAAAAMASILIAIITESSEGNDYVHNWPSTNVLDWLPELGYLLVAVLVSAFPGWLIGQVAVLDPLVKLGLFAGSILVCLPIVLLSQLDIASPWGVVSGNVLASLGRCPVSWMLFYVEVAIIAGAGGAVVYAAVHVAPGLIVLAPPLFVAGLLLYARLIGRLGWKLAETMRVVEEK